jgi:hypothetical protein
MHATYEVVVSESALENLLHYSQQSPEKAELLHNIIIQLKATGPKCQVLELNVASRPIWQHQVDGEHDLYFTIGQGHGGTEVRIAFFGPSLPDSSDAYKQLMHLTGEAGYFDLPDDIQLEKARKVNAYPEFPARKLEKTNGLESYLNPSELDLLNAIEQMDNTIDDLHGRPYRIFRELRPGFLLPRAVRPVAPSIRA